LTRVSSIFSQILQLIPRLEFEPAVRQHQAERHARGFSSWGQFIVMLLCQLGMPSRCAKFAAGCMPAKEKFAIWACPQLQRAHLGLR
jgi:hypothetical protein